MDQTLYSYLEYSDIKKKSLLSMSSESSNMTYKIIEKVQALL